MITLYLPSTPDDAGLSKNGTRRHYARAFFAQVDTHFAVIVRLDRAIRPRLAALLDHFAEIADARQSWKVMYPLREVLFLVVCGTIASGDDYDDIVDWGKAHLAFLRGFAEFHFGIPCADWLRCVMNRIDPDLFMACFSSWVAQCWPDKLHLVAIDGKTSRRSHNRKTGQKALHLVSAFATNHRLVLARRNCGASPTFGRFVKGTPQRKKTDTMPPKSPISRCLSYLRKSY